MIDLQIHSYYSDGCYSPKEIVRQAKVMGLKAIAITDHDSIDGQKEALQAGQNYHLEVVSGIELSVEYQGYELHLLGYFIDVTSRRLHQVLKTIKQVRLKRFRERLRQVNNKLRCFQKKITLKEISQYARGVPGRPHIAQVLIDKELVKTRQEAFSSYLSGQLADKKFFINIKKAFALIKQAKGLAILSHPLAPSISLKLINSSLSGQKSVLNDLIKLGLDGLEVYTPSHSKEDIVRLKRLAKELNLAVSAGTDSHGPWLGYQDIKKTPYSYKILAELKKFYRQKWNQRAVA